MTTIKALFLSFVLCLPGAANAGINIDMIAITVMSAVTTVLKANTKKLVASVQASQASSQGAMALDPALTNPVTMATNALTTASIFIKLNDEPIEPPENGDLGWGWLIGHLQGVIPGLLSEYLNQPLSVEQMKKINNIIKSFGMNIRSFAIGDSAPQREEEIEDEPDTNDDDDEELIDVEND